MPSIKCVCDLNASETSAVDNHCDDIVKMTTESSSSWPEYGPHTATESSSYSESIYLLTSMQDCRRTYMHQMYTFLLTGPRIAEQCNNNGVISRKIARPYRYFILFLDVRGIIWMWDRMVAQMRTETSKIRFTWLVELTIEPARAKPFAIVYDDPYKYSNYIGRHVIQHCNNRQPINSETVPIFSRARFILSICHF